MDKRFSKKLYRVVYVLHGISTHGLNIEKRMSELWLVDCPPSLESVSKWWNQVGVARVTDLRVIPCDPRLPIDTPHIVEI